MGHFAKWLSWCCPRASACSLDVPARPAFLSHPCAKIPTGEVPADYSGEQRLPVPREPAEVDCRKQRVWCAGSGRQDCVLVRSAGDRERPHFCTRICSVVPPKRLTASVTFQPRADACERVFRRFGLVTSKPDAPQRTQRGPPVGRRTIWKNDRKFGHVKTSFRLVTTAREKRRIAKRL